MTPSPDRSDQVPEADALEQDRTLVDDEDMGEAPESLEVPDAYAYEQRQGLAGDDEEDRER